MLPLQTSDLEEKLRSSERKYRLLFEKNLAGIAVTSLEGQVLDCNDAWMQILGYGDAEEVRGQQMKDFYFDPSDDSLLAADRRKEKALGELQLRRKDGTSVWVRLNNTSFSSGSKKLVQVTAIDITERKKAESDARQSDAQLQSFLESSPYGIYRTIVGAGGRFVYANPALVKMLGYDSKDEVMQLNLEREVYCNVEDRRTVVAKIKRDGSYRDLEMRWRKRNGTDLIISSSGRIVPGREGELFTESIAVDITDRKRTEQKVQLLAYYDALTGLPNRTLLQDRLTQAIAAARRAGSKVAALFIDLDRFKTVNDSLGHSFGDSLLQEVARRLMTVAREQDTVARIGGDEFVIVLTAVNDSADAAIAAQRIVNTLENEFVVQGRPLRISCSIGISVSPEHGTDGEALIKNADAAMYRVKESGRNTFRFFTDEINVEAMERLALENSLRVGLERGEFFLVYQPQVEIPSGKIVGLEALIRWQHPLLGLVPPDKFIRVAENCGMIAPIGEWVLRTACSEARRWQDAGLPAVPVAVNVSAVQFRQGDFLKLIQRVLSESGLAPQYLELEVTESLLLADSATASAVLRELAKMGVKLAIDDFGTGYSSLGYLRRFTFGTLKIDRSFISDISSPDSAAITIAIISMAKALNLKVIAEGVETEEQMSFLQENHCHDMQGYYFSKPLRADKVDEKLRGSRPAREDGAVH